MPAGVLTVTSTAPLALGGGLVTVSWVSLTTVRLVPGTEPNMTDVAPVKPAPVTVTVSPPPAAPLIGLIPVTTGIERRLVAPSTICWRWFMMAGPGQFG